MEPYLGEIRMVALGFAPRGWMFCEGQELPIAGNELLFNLIGNTYGGNGTSTFKLPDLQNRVPVHKQAARFPLGRSAGARRVTLTSDELPAHSHAFNVVSDSGSTDQPGGNFLAQSGTIRLYSEVSSTVSLGVSSVGTAAGGSVQPHSNLQPYLCIRFMIAVAGIFPTQN